MFPSIVRANGSQVAMGLLCLLLFMPQFSTEHTDSKGRHIGLPRVYSGDEPHYLVLIHSLMLDFDLDLANNYDRVHHGSNQAGKRFAHSEVDHHVCWYIDGTRFIWSELFDGFNRTAQGGLVAVLRPGVDPKYATAPQYIAHPIGVGLLLAPLLFPFRNTDWVEPLALMMSGVAMISAAVLYRKLLHSFSTDSFSVYATLYAVFLGTPLWHYGRNLFNEAILVLLMTGAFSMALRPNRMFQAGAFVAGAMLFKPQSILVLPFMALPIALSLRKSWTDRAPWKQLILLGALPFVAGLLNLYFNNLMYGSPFLGAYPFYKGNIFTGLYGLLISERGVLQLAPVLALALAGWPLLVKEERLRSVVVWGSMLPMLGIAAWWKYWDGGSCYGPRLIVPILPLFGLGIVRLLDVGWMKQPWARGAFALVLMFSITLNGVAAFRYWECRDQHPWKVLQEHWTRAS